MHGIIGSITCLFLLMSSCLAYSYEDKPITMRVVLDDSVFFAVGGVEYREIDFEYRPGIQQIYFNGRPIFLTGTTIADSNCASYCSDNVCIAKYVEMGLSCGEARERFRDRIYRLTWDIGDWLASSNGQFDTLGYAVSVCRESSISDSFEWADIKDGELFIKFDGFAKSMVVPPGERYLLGTSYMPFREGVGMWVARLLGKLEEPASRSRIYFYTSSFGGQEGGCCVAQARHQLEIFLATGTCVEGPINCSLMEGIDGKKSGQ